LLEGIGSFFAVDKLEGSNKYLCEHCKVRSNARKRFLLDSLPQVATFQLKRFTNSLRKIGKFIQFPLTIDLGRHLEAPHKGIMKLYALVVHAGGSSYSGHYYAFVRVGDDWFKVRLI
jgi:ubiquitin C-terminal hydrolase